MSNPETPDANRRRPSLADYLMRHDLPTLFAEARLDYNEASSGAPRLLNQKDIAARFATVARRPAKPRHE